MLNTIQSVQFAACVNGLDRLYNLMSDSICTFVYMLPVHHLRN